MLVRPLRNLAGMAAVALLTACGGGSAVAPSVPTSQIQPMSVAPAQPMSIGFSESGFVESDAATLGSVGVRLIGETATTSKVYGRLLGYAPGIVTKISHVITLTSGQSVIFHNVDTAAPHTASLLGDATKSGAPWPASFDGSSTQSKAGTDISTADFSTGTMEPGKSSLKYVAKVPGFYMFGCFYHYNLDGMRDIIIVK